MASITKQPNGRRMIQFVAADGKRRSIRLGKISQRNAESVKVKVELLAAAGISGHAIDADTSRWVASLDSVMVEKLANVGLVPKRESATLGAFIDGYIAKRTDVKETTAETYNRARKNLIKFFGAEKPLQDITPGDADEWRLFLIEQPLEESTVRRRCETAKQFFTAAMRRGLVSQNPFKDLKSSVLSNPSRFYFVSREEAEKVIEACPDAQCRLLFALCRYSGLRSPSETLLLRWSDINWEHGRMLVRSPKTEHHPGGESRLVPLFPELRPYLDESFDLAEPGTEYVFNRFRQVDVNYRRQFLRIIKHAGLKPWPKIFQNLRSTRQTELEEIFPSHVVCAWIGNSEAVARKHYLQVTDHHFEKALQNPMQQAHVTGRNDSQLEMTEPKKALVLQGFAGNCDLLHNGSVVFQRP